MNDLVETLTLKLEEYKTYNIIVINVEKITTVTNFMIIASVISPPHAQAVTKNFEKWVKDQGFPFRLESDACNEWILFNLYEVIVHLMLDKVRNFYQLEELWSR